MHWPIVEARWMESSTVPRCFFVQRRGLAEEGEERTNMTSASPSVACHSELPARARPSGEPSCPLAVSCSGPVNRGRQQRELRARPSNAKTAEREVMCCRTLGRTSISGLHFVLFGCFRRADVVFERSVRVCERECQVFLSRVRVLQSVPDFTFHA